MGRKELLSQEFRAKLTFGGNMQIHQNHTKTFNREKDLWTRMRLGSPRETLTEKPPPQGRALDLGLRASDYGGMISPLFPGPF